MSRILVVDDEPHIADGLRFNLEAEGHDVTVTHDGEQALDLLVRDQLPVDVVILDVMLPGKDGFETAAELRAAGQYVPILMLTARGRPDDVLRGFESGADDYLPKPFELAILLARVRSLLRRSGWTRPAEGSAGRTAGDAEAGRRPGTGSRIGPVVEDRPQLRFGGNVLDLDALELRVADKAYHLTVMEADLLRYLLQN